MSIRDAEGAPWMLPVMWSHPEQYRKGTARQHVQRPGWGRPPITWASAWVDAPLCGIRVSDPNYELWIPHDYRSSSRPTCSRCLASLRAIAREGGKFADNARKVLDAIAAEEAEAGIL